MGWHILNNLKNTVLYTLICISRDKKIYIAQLVIMCELNVVVPYK